MRVTIKGQVIIPLKIRNMLNITQASEVEFIVGEDDRVYIQKVESDMPSGSRFSKLRGSASIKMSTEEIMALTRTME
ncbi:MAG: AbrB/MazE/SpoVT family DNA-binding domain-containing protein [Chloroflexi bacterium]|nr:AbrB/MazE/SpoVT family DNA-binding domain-containing protein [Chloroflexota bacterium]